MYLFLISSSRVIEYLEQRAHKANVTPVKVAVVYVYLRYSDRHQLTADKIVKCLLKQLVCQLDVFPCELDKWQYPRPSTVGLSKLFIDYASQFFKVFMVLDGLDECERIYRENLLPHIQRFLDAGLKVFYSCRMGLQINLSSQKIGEIEIVSRREDLAIFITERLKHANTIGELTDENREVIIKTIVKKSEGL